MTHPRTSNMDQAVCTCNRPKKGWTCRCTCGKCGCKVLVWIPVGRYLDKDLVCQECGHVQDTWNC